MTIYRLSWFNHVDKCKKINARRWIDVAAPVAVADQVNNREGGIVVHWANNATRPARLFPLFARSVIRIVRTVTTSDSRHVPSSLFSSFSCQKISKKTTCEGQYMTLVSGT